MDFIAGPALGYVDIQITSNPVNQDDCGILRYHDDHRIFASSDADPEQVLKTIIDALRTAGMDSSAAKTLMNSKVIEGSIKPGKLAGIDVQDLGKTNTKRQKSNCSACHLHSAAAVFGRLPRQAFLHVEQAQNSAAQPKIRRRTSAAFSIWSIV